MTDMVPKPASRGPGKAFIRKDVRIAWNVLSLLTDDYQKIYTLFLEVNERYKMGTSHKTVEHIIRALGIAGLVSSKKGVGIKRVKKPVIMLDVIRALGIELSYSTSTPDGKALSKIENYLGRIEVDRIDTRNK